MTHVSKGIFIVGAKRTPFCKYGGYIRELPASTTFAAAAKDALHSANLDASLVDSTVIGNIHYLSQCDGGKTPRYCGTYSGVPLDKPALGVNRTCGSGLQALITGALEILTGTAKICLVGGTEAMSSLPLFVRNVRFGSVLGAKNNLEDPLNTVTINNAEAEKVAESIAEKYKISREECDQYILDSHLKWREAKESGVFRSEIANLTVTNKKQEIDVSMDEVLSHELTLKDLAKAPTLLQDGNVVTQTNSSAPADGAAAVILADEESVSRLKLTPLARLAAWACVGSSGTDAGLEDTVAISQILQLENLATERVDLFEINELFAPQVIAAVRRLKVDPSVVNTSGGTLAVGNPTAATGARMAVHIAHRLREQSIRKAIAASSCGGRQGLAVLFEKP